MTWRELDEAERDRRRALLNAEGLEPETVELAAGVVHARWAPEARAELLALEQLPDGARGAELLLAAALWLDAIPVDADGTRQVREQPRRGRARAARPARNVPGIGTVPAVPESTRRDVEQAIAGPAAAAGAAVGQTAPTLPVLPRPNDDELVELLRDTGWSS